ncbi:threonine aspartase 1-like isoform X2 [Belonocnema kinseyi]|uniref:threonine aspartase 1-like isoform X2 n=1 Tax=Belonocnema kinseyi TaxID=2817044 RepID=UPI00143D704D|nr:threonine aspartase 1-like isoform X2 [Belonocnema kinseyi]
MSKLLKNLQPHGLLFLSERGESDTGHVCLNRKYTSSSECKISFDPNRKIMNRPKHGFIAVHVGAGQHSEKLKDKYQKLCKEACRKGIESLITGCGPLEAVVKATTVLENSPLTNAGYGSNLTIDGKVECDASVMDGSNLHFGAVGAIKGVKNPIEVAKHLCEQQSISMSHGRIPPSFLVGSGAHTWAKEMGIQTIPPDDLISVKADKVYKHYKRKVDDHSNETERTVKKRMDTVGAVCVDEFGNVASACSSGGIILKYSGRVGQVRSHPKVTFQIPLNKFKLIKKAGVWGCGTWAHKGENSVGVSTSGCGEHLIRTTLARTIADAILNVECPTTSLHAAMKKDFIDSRFLSELEQKLGGAIAIRYSSEEKLGDLLWSHSTNTMIVGYMNSMEKTAVSHMSVLPLIEVGKKAVVEGICFKLPKV